MGGLVHSMDQRLYIALLGLCPMIECQLHCLDGFRYFVAEAQQTENGLHLSVMDAGRCAEVRRQGYAVMRFNLRV